MTGLFPQKQWEVVDKIPCCSFTYLSSSIKVPLSVFSLASAIPVFPCRYLSQSSQWSWRVGCSLTPTSRLVTSGGWEPCSILCCNPVPSIVSADSRHPSISVGWVEDVVWIPFLSHRLPLHSVVSLFTSKVYCTVLTREDQNGTATSMLNIRWARLADWCFFYKGSTSKYFASHGLIVTTELLSLEPWNSQIVAV